MKLEAGPDRADREVRLAEYQALRQEVGSRSGHQQTLLGLNLTAVAAVAALSLPESGDPPERANLLLILPFVSSALGALWTDHHAMIDKLGRYVQTQLWRYSPSWEEYHRASSPPLKDRLFKLATGLTFLGPAWVSLLLTALPDDWGTRLAWALGAVVTALASYYMAVAFTRLESLTGIPVPSGDDGGPRHEHRSEARPGDAG